MAISSWNTDWFPLPGQAVFDRPNQQVAAVARTGDSLDLFSIGSDHRVWSTSWRAARGWQDDWLPLPGPAVCNPATQHVAAVSRAPGNLDLFVIGFDNRVWSTFWSDLLGWHGDWFALPGKAIFNASQRLAAVSLSAGNLDVFAIGFDNHGWSSFWNTAHGWSRNWVPLPGQAMFDHDKQRITAVARSPDNLDLFAIGFDDHACATFWTGEQGWHDNWFPLPGRTQFDHQAQQIAAVARTPGHLDLFVIGFDDRVWSIAWTAARGWLAEWFALPARMTFSHHTQQITALSRAPGNLDLFLPGLDGRVWSTFWNDVGGWHHEWFPLPGQAPGHGATLQLAVVARKQSAIDLFASGGDQRIWSTFWGEHDAHPAIRLRAVAAQTPFVEVVGEGFTPHQAVKVGYDIVADSVPETHQQGEDTLTTDAAGRFVERIAVNLDGAVVTAQAEATDLASEETATASI